MIEEEINRYDKDLAVEEDVVEHSEMDDQGTTECEGLEKETPGESGDPTEVEEKENKGTQKCKKRKLIKHKVSINIRVAMYILSEMHL